LFAFLAECPGVFFRKMHRGLFVVASFLACLYGLFVWYFLWEPETCTYRVGGFGARCYAQPFPVALVFGFSVRLFSFLLQYMFFTHGVPVRARVVVFAGYVVLAFFSRVVFTECFRVAVFAVVADRLKVADRWRLWCVIPFSLFPWWCCAFVVAVPFVDWRGEVVFSAVSEPEVQAVGAVHPYLKVPLLPVMHRYRTYFEQRPDQGGMTPDERSLALVGDRVLKVLLAHVGLQDGLTVGEVSAREMAQADESFLRWMSARNLGEGRGAKTRASFVEVMWAEVWLAYVAGDVTFFQLGTAFRIFDAEVRAVRFVSG